ncbi:hypothetical protein FOMPIDRAFT_94389, partial [Fomitopsis schrenkii]
MYTWTVPFVPTAANDFESTALYWLTVSPRLLTWSKGMTVFTVVKCVDEITSLFRIAQKILGEEVANFRIDIFLPSKGWPTGTAINF